MIMDASTDILWMRRALKLASLSKQTHPNPMVGCVIVDLAGNKIAEGRHERPGEPHAEIHALREAGSHAQSSTVYVTLEPCSHFGRTPPCADALIAAKVKRVVVATVDPDRRVAGLGINRLADAGILVEIGVLESEARGLNRAYFKHRETGMPFVTIKMATTIDGKTATSSGDSKWITTAITRKWVHRQLRARSHAIMVGVGTVLADDPSLTIRLNHSMPDRQPRRIIVDTRLRTPIEAKVLHNNTSGGDTIIAYVETAETKQKIGFFADIPVTLLACEPDANGRVSVNDVLHRLGTEHSIVSVLVEGGAELNASLFAARLVDRYITTIGSKIIGGASSTGPIGGQGMSSLMDEAIIPSEIWFRRCATDIVLDCSL